MNLDEDIVPTFGYGTLILPTSIISRFEKIKGRSIYEIYNKNIGYNNDKLIRDEAISKWLEYKDKIKLIPAKLYGFKRFYSKKLNHIDRCVLEAIQTKNKKDWINGILIHGLTKKQKESITKTEKGYKNKVIKNPSIEFYNNIDNNVIGTKHPERIEIFLRDSDENEIKPICPRNQTCHGRIMFGIDMLGEIYSHKLVKKFKEDFEKTTYEVSSRNSDKFNTVFRNNLIS